MITVLGTASTTVITPPLSVTSPSGDIILGISAAGGGVVPGVGAVTCGGVAMNLLATYSASYSKVWIYYLKNVAGGTKAIETNLYNVNYDQGIVAYTVSGLVIGSSEYYGGAGPLNCNFTDADTNGIIIKIEATNPAGIENINIITAGITQAMTVSLTGICAVAARFKSTSPMGIMTFT